MLIITYTAEHNHPVPTHRNSLAGSTRQKFPSGTTITATSTASGEGGEGSSPVAGLSPNTPLTASMEEELLHDEMENEEEDEGMLLVQDAEMVREDKFLIMILGQEGEYTGDVQLNKIGDDFSDLLDDPCFNPPWTVSGGINTTAVAGAGAS
jgi:WRKY transcription factor 22